MSTRHHGLLLHLVFCVVFFLATSATAQNAAVTINVNASVNRHAINPNVYGVAHATTAALNDLNSPLNRNGGNNTTRHNWQLNADNQADDWYYESIGDTSAVAGERGDTFITNSQAANAEAMLTIPMIGWVAKLGPSRSKLASFSIAKYGQQTGNDWQWFPDAGNGIWTSGQYVTGNDPQRRECSVRLAVSTGLGAASAQPVGDKCERWLAVLHPRQRTKHLARDSS